MTKRIETDVDISNLALLLIRQPFIDELVDDASVQAKVCNLIYDGCRKNLLEKYVWNFAFTCKGLTMPLTDGETIDVKGTGYQYVYTLPQDFIRLIDVVNESGGRLLPYAGSYVGSKDPYLFASGRIYCNIPPLKAGNNNDVTPTVFIKYIRDVEDVKLMPQYFKEVLVLEMALKIANFFDDSKQYLSMVNSMLEQKLDEAKRIDAQQAVLRSFEYTTSFIDGTF